MNATRPEAAFSPSFIQLHYQIYIRPKPNFGQSAGKLLLKLDY